MEASRPHLDRSPKIAAFRPIRILLVVLAIASLPAGLSGCKRDQQKAASPLVAPPLIKEAGVLRAGVDLSYPPFAGTDNGQQAGIDVDVAKALAGKLGLDVDLVDVKPSEAATQLSSGNVDVVLSVPLAQGTGGGLAYAGSYISDAPALFARVATSSVEPSMTLARVGAQSIGAQQGSPAYWLLDQEFGREAFRQFDTLREALLLVSQGEMDLAAGDAVVGAYIARDMPEVRMVGQLAPAGLLGVATAAENKQLADAVRQKLDELSSGGALTAIRRKWVGPLPTLTLPASSSTTSSP